MTMWYREVSWNVGFHLDSGCSQSVPLKCRVLDVRGRHMIDRSSMANGRSAYHGRSPYHIHELKQVNGVFDLLYHVNSIICLLPYEISNAGTEVDLLCGLGGGTSLRRLVQCFHVDSFDVDCPIVKTVALIINPE